MKFLHLGVPLNEKIEGKEYSYVEPLKLYVTSSGDHEFNLQFVWAENDSPLPDIVRREKHLSIQVDNMDESLSQFDSVVFHPIQINDKVKVAFAIKDYVLFELMEFSG